MLTNASRAHSITKFMNFYHDEWLGLVGLCVFTCTLHTFCIPLQLAN